jgi:hypothetical protein
VSRREKNPVGIHENHVPTTSHWLRTVWCFHETMLFASDNVLT